VSKLTERQRFTLERLRISPEKAVPIPLSDMRPARRLEELGLIVLELRPADSRYFAERFRSRNSLKGSSGRWWARLL
jgi:hypothetical protein